MMTKDLLMQWLDNKAYLSEKINEPYLKWVVTAQMM